jgi:HK97 family phage major capsid protein
VYTAVKRGDLTKMSFAFSVAENGETFENNTRTITKIERIFEISPVNFPAYNDTAVFARNKNNKGDSNMQNFNPVTGAAAAFEGGAERNSDITKAEYKSAFFKSMLGQTLTAAETRAFNAVKAEKRADAFNTLTNSAAVVPDATLNEIISKARTMGGLFAEIRMFNIPSNVTVPIGTPTGAALWHIEGTPVDRTKADVNPVNFAGYELLKIFSLSVAAKRMSVAAFERYITEELTESIRAALNDAILNGTGTGQPTGILSGITWDASNSIDITTFTGDDILTLMSMLARGYSNGAKFAMSSHTLFNRVHKTKNSNGDYIFTIDNQNDNIVRLFGYPIVIDDFITDDTILFGNFKYYGVNIPEGIAVEVSRESGFTSGLIDYRAMAVADGKPLVQEAFAKLTITTTP